MNFYIPNYDECLKIVKENAKYVFYSVRNNLDDYTIETFGYRYAEYNNFINPLIDSDINALELKGISFIYDEEDSYNYNIMFHKFWELNQYEHTMYDKFKGLKIKKVMLKEDGNLISFVKFPNDKILAKTKKGIKNIHCDISNYFYNENKNYRDFISFCLENDIVPLFEVIGKDIGLFIEYEGLDLILLNLRNNKTGEYINFEDINYDLSTITKIKTYDYDLDTLIDMSNYVKGIEGWVIQFENDDMLKIKTKFYENLKFIYKEKKESNGFLDKKI